MNGACAAQTCATAELGTHQAQLIAQYPKQRHFRGGCNLVELAVDVKLVFHLPSSTPRQREQGCCEISSEDCPRTPASGTGGGPWSARRLTRQVWTLVARKTSPFRSEGQSFRQARCCSTSPPFF